MMADMGSNELQITGEAVLLRHFREQADERFVPSTERDPYNSSSPSVLSFHRLFPVPADVAARDYGALDGGCEWQRTHWGIKWGASSASLDEGTDVLIYSLILPGIPRLRFCELFPLTIPH